MINFRKYFIVGTNDSGLKDTMNGMVTGELIRCKDCKHYYEKQWVVGGGSYTGCWYQTIANAQPNDFCSRAERRKQMRLIDADALMRDIEQYHLSNGKFQYWVELQSTVDAVPVIRCKDCKHWQKSSINYNEYVCYWGGYVKKEDDFCSWAEREEKTNSHGGT